MAARFSKRSIMLWAACLVLLVLIDFLFTGIWTIQQNEQGVVLRFGAVDRKVYPGLVFTLPWPFEEVMTVNIKETLKMPVGFRFPQASDPSFFTADESQWLTGDTNVIDVEMMIHYTISDPVRYLFRVGPGDADFLIRKSAESVLTETLGIMSVDAILTTGKSFIETQTRVRVQELLDRLETGVLLSRANLQKISPPMEVIEAFQDVSSAKADRERTIQEADGYLKDLMPTARYQAARIEEEALAYKSSVVSIARGKAEAFKSLLEEYRKAPEITETRLFLDTVGKILGKVRKVLLPPDDEGERKLKIID